jgi:hypothetical protein
MSLFVVWTKPSLAIELATEVFCSFGLQLNLQLKLSIVAFVSQLHLEFFNLIFLQLKLVSCLVPSVATWVVQLKS